MKEVRKIQKSLISGEKEKRELMKSLAQVKDDLTRLQISQESPTDSYLNLTQERIRYVYCYCFLGSDKTLMYTLYFFTLSAASQTDLCSDNFPIGAKEMAKLRLRYDEWRKRVKNIQEKLAALEERVNTFINDTVSIYYLIQVTFYKKIILIIFLNLRFNLAK